MNEITADLDILVAEIKGKFSDTEIILFGSYAKGNATKESDIDLCIIIDKTLMRKIDLIREVRRTIAPISTRPIDIVVYSRDEFNQRSLINTTFEYKIKNEGLKIA